jgi:hypothetical protein
VSSVLRSAAPSLTRVRRAFVRSSLHMVVFAAGLGATVEISVTFRQPPPWVATPGEKVLALDISA